MGRTAATTIRAFLVFLDTMTMLLGVALLGLAVYLYFAQHFSQLSADNYRLPMVLFVIMGIGGVIALVSALGLSGACCRSYCCLSLYAALFCMIVAIQCIAILFVYIFKVNVKDFIGRALSELLRAYKSTPNKDMGTALDFVQSLCRCCGVTGFIDFFGSLSLPRSCCTSASAYSSNNIVTCTAAMLQDRVPGCRQRFLDVLYGPNMAITLGVFFGLILLELILITMACYLCYRIRRARE